MLLRFMMMYSRRMHALKTLHLPSAYLQRTPLSISAFYMTIIVYIIIVIVMMFSRRRHINVSIQVKPEKVRLGTE